MGVNYYLHFPDTNHCTCCGRFDKGKVLHIGKSSFGWCFCLHVTDKITSLDDWKKLFSSDGTWVLDEDKKEIPIDRMLKIITQRCSYSDDEVPTGFDSLESYCFSKGLEKGPNKLVRFRIDGVHCVGHGDTWDLITGEFS